MKIPAVFLLSLLAIVLCSCQSTTMPTVADMDRYYKEAERRANVRIADLAQQRDSGQMSAEEFDYRAKLVRDDIPRRANDLAWTRHELAQSEMRAQGIPTPDAPVAIGNPQAGGMQGSFYRQPGDPSGNQSNGNARVFTPAITGFTPGAIAGQAAMGGLGAGALGGLGGSPPPQ